MTKPDDGYNIGDDVTKPEHPTDPPADDKAYTIIILPGEHGYAEDNSPLKTGKDGIVPELPVAIPDESYVFDRWVDENGDEVMTGDILDHDIAIKPIFTPEEYDNTRTLTPVDGEHGTVDDKTPIETDKKGVVQNNLPNVTPEDGFAFEKWVDGDGNEVKHGDILDRDVTIKPVCQEKQLVFSVDYKNGLMLPESSNTATFAWDNAPDDFELAGITSSDPSVAKVSEVFDSKGASQMVEVKALRRGTAKFIGVSTTGETAAFDVLVSELGDSRPTASIDKAEEIKPGDTIEPDDITVEIPTVTPDGGSDTVTVTPNDVSGGEIEEGKNVVSATVDANGVDITINIIINITINQGTPVDPTDHTHTITINPDGGNGHADSSDPLETDRDGKVPELPTVTPDEGYVFDKWVNEAGDEVKTGDTIENDVTITPTFKPDENYKVYTITIEPGEHGRADDGSPLKTDVNGIVPALPAVTVDEGYVFDKWVDEGVSEVKQGNTLTRDITITPTCKQDNTHTLTPIDGDHGTVVDKTPIKTDQHGVVQNHFPSVKNEDGYKIERWMYVDSVDTVKPGDVLTEDVEIKPVFTKDNTHMLTPVDGDHGTVPDKTPIQTDKRGRVQNNLPKVIPEDGYKFEKWVDESGNEVVAGDVLINDITIIPTFIEGKSYTVGFGVEQSYYDTIEFSVEVHIKDGQTLKFEEGYPTGERGFKYFENISDNMKIVAEGDLTFTVKCNYTDGYGYNFLEKIYIYRENVDAKYVSSSKDTIIGTTIYSVSHHEYSYTIDASTINSGENVYILLILNDRVLNYSGLHTLNFADGDHGKVPNKSARVTSEHGVVLDNLPNVIPDAGYEFDKWTVKSFIYEKSGKRYCNLEVKPGDLLKFPEPKTVTLAPIYKLAEPSNLHLLTPIDGDHGVVLDKTPVQTDKRGIVQNNLPNVTPNSGFGFEKWVDIDSGKEVMPGDRLTKNVTIKPFFAVDNAHTLTPVDGDNCSVDDKTPIKTDVNGVVQNHFPVVTHDDVYKVEKWLYLDSGKIVTPGDVLTEDVYIKPVLTLDNGPYTIYFQTANYYTLSDTTPLTTVEDRKIPMGQMPEVSPIVSHFFDGVWVNVDTGEVVDAETKLKSDITVKPQINCLFTERNGAVTGFSDYAQDKNVESITIPNNIMGKTVTRIGTTAFSAHINHRTDSDGRTFSDPNPKAFEVKHVTIQEGITELGKQSFGSYNILETMNLESISLPDGLKVIGEGAFYECGKLTSITIPDTVTMIGDAAFWDCGLESIHLGKSVRSLGFRAFMWCDSLTHINLPYSLRSIGERCFESAGLESVTVPDGCTVGEQAFIFCENLKTATLGEGTTSLYCTFQRCTNLKTIRLPKSITSINPNAFYYCPNLAYIYIKGSKNSVSGAPWSSSQTHPTVIWTS